MSEATFKGPTKSAIITRDGNTGTARTAMTWKVSFAVPVSFEKFICDLRIAGNYTFSIDAVNLATVNGVTAAQTGVQFVPSSPVELAAGEHTFKLTTGSNIQWYVYQGDAQLTPVVTGDGNGWVGWARWDEPAAAAHVPGEMQFRVADGFLLAEMVYTTESNSTYAAQTWTITLDTPLYLCGMQKRLQDTDTGYAFTVDGNAFATVAKIVSDTRHHNFLPTTPMLLAAGVHTLKLDPVNASRQFFYLSNMVTAYSGNGGAHVTAHTQWAEPANGAAVECRLFFMPPMSLV